MTICTLCEEGPGRRIKGRFYYVLGNSWYDCPKCGDPTKMHPSDPNYKESKND